MQCAQGLLVASRSDNATCTKKFCYLYSQLTRHAGCTENEYVFIGHQLGAEGECEPSGDAGIRQGSSGLVIYFLRDRKRKCPAHDRALCHRTVRGSGSTEEHPLPIAQMPNSIGAADEGEVVRTGIV